MLQSRSWYKHQEYDERLRLMEKQRNDAIKATAAWKDAWYAQREATGKNYWNGFEDGRHHTYRQSQRYEG